MHVENIMKIMLFSWSCIAVNLIGHSVFHKNELTKREKTHVSFERQNILSVLLLN